MAAENGTVDDKEMIMTTKNLGSSISSNSFTTMIYMVQLLFVLLDLTTHLYGYELIKSWDQENIIDPLVLDKDLKSNN
ncbi:hypothetical protein S83_061805 [Arachis hypogaea]